MAIPQSNNGSFEGIVPVYKPRGITSFQLVRLLRKHLGVKKIGHAGTLDPFAEGVMLMLIGRNYTRESHLFLNEDKEYIGRIRLGITTDTYDCEGAVLSESPLVPARVEIEHAVRRFQGTIAQVPPMYSAKKINGKKLYELARKGIAVERTPVPVQVRTEILAYEYPYLDIKVACSKGTYIRSIAHDLGNVLGTGGHLVTLVRTKSGQFTLDDCYPGQCLQSAIFELAELNGKAYDLDNGSLKRRIA